MWINVLRQEVALKGPKQVATELGMSRSTVDLVTQGKYPAQTRRIEEKVSKIYGGNGTIECPVLGKITPNKCADAWRKAGTIGSKAGNPETLRLYRACLKCRVRG